MTQEEQEMVQGLVRIIEALTQRLPYPINQYITSTNTPVYPTFQTFTSQPSINISESTQEERFGSR